MASASAGGSPVQDYYDGALDRFAGWIKHQDSKAAFALVVLGIGLTDLLDHAEALAEAHKLASGWGNAATAMFWCAVSAGVLTVALAWLTVRPRTRRNDETRGSAYFFGTVAKYATAKEYQSAVTALGGDFEAHLASQVWELAKDVAAKVRYAKAAYVTVALFLVFWGAARIFLAVAT